MHHLVALELHRQWVADFERRAAIERQRPPRSRRSFPRIRLTVPRIRRRAQAVARAGC